MKREGTGGVNKKIRQGTGSKSVSYLPACRPAAATMPICLIAPPNTFRVFLARLMNSEDPSNREPAAGEQEENEENKRRIRERGDEKQERGDEAGKGGERGEERLRESV